MHRRKMEEQGKMAPFESNEGNPSGPENKDDDFLNNIRDSIREHIDSLSMIPEMDKTAFARMLPHWVKDGRVQYSNAVNYSESMAFVQRTNYYLEEMKYKIAIEDELHLMSVVHLVKLGSEKVISYS